MVRVLRSQGGAALASMAMAMPAAAVQSDRLQETDHNGRDAAHDSRTSQAQAKAADVMEGLVSLTEGVDAHATCTRVRARVVTMGGARRAGV